MQRGTVAKDKRLHPDDDRLDPVWRKCAELKIPANVHIADHPSCWQPLGPNQERTPDFQHFNLYGKDVLSFEELIARRDRMLAKHPQTTFIACHLGNQGHDLESLAKALDKYPNLFVDISGGVFWNPPTSTCRAESGGVTTAWSFRPTSSRVCIATMHAAC
jgi:predicted TIM-barrel fold metal-dependent hydrolase